MQIWQKALYTFLISRTPVNNLIGQRVYGERLPQSPTLPAVTLSQNAEEPTYTHDRVPTLNGVEVSVEIFAADQAGTAAYDLAHAVASVVYQEMHSFTGTIAGIFVDGARLLNQTDFYDGETKTHRVVMDYAFFYRR
jgi:hypothetical protein